MNNNYGSSNKLHPHQELSARVGDFSYKTKITLAGEYQDVCGYPIGRHSGSSSGSRAPKSPEAIRRANFLRAQKKLVHLLHCNFRPDDRFVTFTYAYASDEERVRKDVRNIIGKLRRRADKKGMVLKYLYVIESTTGRDGIKRWHVHMLLNQGIVTLEELESMWPQGMINNRPIHYESDGLTGLAQYITKAKSTQEKTMKRRWACGRNLERPVEIVDETLFDNALIRELCSESRNGQRAIVEEMFPGYELTDDVTVKHNEFTPGMNIHFLMRRIKQ